ncbi:hypothetical protein [Devosia psychrophila]|uniref:Invasion protein IalB, involved in pathogenesis n=1 Tax=Devosia psychrophila TaxID=728005 RepID=A0A0F5PT01_9HYPH|nr:hypothetical protein [Devosia psychrophila]KKC31773.1 hypothetical protein WH91_17245 [Devosia psychrophila]SFC79902.1 hypothetical protein SAMN04488059_11191 [Devosia psychrophila]
MGLHRTQKGLILALVVLATPAVAQQSGWHYSPQPGEGDRATLGCDSDATPQEYTCVAVRCEDDLSTGVHVHTNRQPVLGEWEMTLDRENASFTAEPSSAPYGGRFMERTDWLLDRIEQGSFIYLRNVDDTDPSFAYIDLSGSLQAITRALAFCAPRVPPEPKAAAGV